MFKPCLLLSVVLICLLASALAVPENVITGPYKISFDLGYPQDMYKITVADPKETELLVGRKK